MVVDAEEAPALAPDKFLRLGEGGAPATLLLALLAHPPGPPARSFIPVITETATARPVKINPVV